MKRASLFAIALALSLSACKKNDKPTESGGSGKTAEPVAPADAAAPPADAAASPADAATPPPADAAAATPTEPADPMTTVCPKVLAKIEECVEDKAFVEALMKGADAKQKKIIKRLIAEVAEWTANPCVDMAANYEFPGFTNRWEQVADPAILESCGKLGEAVQAAGGLFGGDQAM